MPPKGKARAVPKSFSKDKSMPESTEERLPRSPNELKNRTVQEALKGAAGSGHFFGRSPNGEDTYKAHNGPGLSKKTLRKLRKDERGAEDSSPLSPQVPAEAPAQGHPIGSVVGDSIGVVHDEEGPPNEGDVTAYAHTSGFQCANGADGEIDATREGDHEGSVKKVDATNATDNYPVQLRSEDLITELREPTGEMAHSNANISKDHAGRLKTTNSTDDKNALPNQEQAFVETTLSAGEDKNASASTEETTNISHTAGFNAVLNEFNTIIAEMAEIKHQYQRVRELVQVLIEKIEAQQGGR